MARKVTTGKLIPLANGVSIERVEHALQGQPFLIPKVRKPLVQVAMRETVLPKGQILLKGRSISPPILLMWP